MPKFSDDEQYRQHHIAKLKIADTDEQDQGAVATLLRDEREDAGLEGLSVKKPSRTFNNRSSRQR